MQNKTARQLFERFPGCKIINGYGSTEATILITQTEVTPQMAASEQPLPVGTAR